MNGQSQKYETATVALRKESVDRNYPPEKPVKIGENVALRKESVDRNYGRFGAVQYTKVALRKESVDRNDGLMSVVRFATGRSPQGERG